MVKAIAILARQRARATTTALVLACAAHGSLAADRPWTNPFVLTKPASAVSAPQAVRPRTPGVYVDREKVGLGEAVTITVIRSREASSQGALDLAALQEAFEVREVNRGDSEGREQWTLVVYPRKVGRLLLPPWDLRGPARTVEVTDGSPGAPRVRMRLHGDPLPLRERQTATLTLEACAEGMLHWRRPELPAGEGVLLRPLGQSEVDTQVDGLRCTATRWHWALLPTAAGTLRIQAPALQGTRFGQVLRLPAPEVRFEVAAVPRWLPPEVAVGPVEIRIRAGTAAGAAAFVGVPWPLHLEVRGNLAPEALRQVLQAHLAALPEWSRYPVEVAPAVAMPTPDRGATPLWNVTVHARPGHAGSLVWPALDWAWFDPVSGQVQSVRSEVVRVEVDDPLRRRRLLAAGAGLAVLACGLTGAWLWRSQAWRWRRWRLARALRRVRTTDELHTLLLSFRLASGHRADRPAPTLGDWRRAFEAHSHCEDPAPWLDALERLLYAGDARPRRDVPQDLLQPLLRWLSTVAPRRGPSSPGWPRSGLIAGPSGSQRPVAS